MKFLYGNTLRHPEVVPPWLRPRVAKKLPVVLSREEVEALLGGVESIKYRAVLMTAYGSGLRIGEVCRLHVKDVDSARMLPHVRDGKGGRDRYALLSPRLLEAPRTYWRAERPAGPYLFPGHIRHANHAGPVPAVERPSRGVPIDARLVGDGPVSSRADGKSPSSGSLSTPCILRITTCSRV